MAAVVLRIPNATVLVEGAVSTQNPRGAAPSEKNAAGRQKHGDDRLRLRVAHFLEVRHNELFQQLLKEAEREVPVCGCTVRIHVHLPGCCASCAIRSWSRSIWVHWAYPNGFETYGELACLMLARFLLLA